MAKRYSVGVDVLFILFFILINALDKFQCLYIHIFIFFIQLRRSESASCTAADVCNLRDDPSGFVKVFINKIIGMLTNILNTYLR